MTTEVNRCSNCGAPLTQSGPDVRKGVCAFCGCELTVAIDSAQIAAGMHLDLANAEAFMNQLARSLGHAFGQRAKVHWDRGAIVKIELDLGKDMFVAKRDIEQVQGQHKKMVRGVALKTTDHPIDVWVGMLHKAIATHVNTNAKAAIALANLRIT